jgi:hypothetical protein
MDQQIGPDPPLPLLNHMGQFVSQNLKASPGERRGAIRIKMDVIALGEGDGIQGGGERAEMEFHIRKLCAKEGFGCGPDFTFQHCRDCLHIV